MASNYCPISVTSVCCKTLEHIISKHMLNHVKKEEDCIPLQHGFCSGHSCESQLISTMHDIMQNFDSKQQTDLIILEFTKHLTLCLIRNLHSNLVNMVSRVILTSGLRVSWCTKSNKLLLKGSSPSHALLTQEYLKVMF